MNERISSVATLVASALYSSQWPRYLRPGANVGFVEGVMCTGVDDESQLGTVSILGARMTKLAAPLGHIPASPGRRPVVALADEDKRWDRGDPAEALARRIERDGSAEFYVRQPFDPSLLNSCKRHCAARQHNVADINVCLPREELQSGIPVEKV